MTAQKPSVSVVDVDLSRFSLGHERAWATAPLLIVVVAAWFFVLIFIANAGEKTAALWLGVVSALLLVAFSVWGMIQRMSSSTTGHKRACFRPSDGKQPPSRFKMTLDEIAAAFDRFKSTPVKGDLAAMDPARTSKRVRAILYSLLGVIILVGGIPLLIAMRVGALLMPGIILLGLAMFWMFTRARRVVQHSAQLVTQHDPRPPILFLRSFWDDKKRIRQRVSVMGLPSTQPIRIEEALDRAIRGFGPFLAVGEPKEGLPQLGAARVYLSDDRWQAAVLAWIESANFIVMLAGPTEFVHWEMKQIVKHGRLNRLLLFLPPGRKPAASNASELRRERWKNVMKPLAETPFGPAMRDIDISNMLLVQFCPDGRLFVYRSDYDLVQDYELAMMLAIYVALSEPTAAV